jgi:hypothetical protein
VPNNLEFLRHLVCDPRFAAGHTTTKFLEGFSFQPRVMEVVLPGGPRRARRRGLAWRRHVPSLVCAAA